MKVPLTVSDFLDRAETVYPESLALVDEPDQPGALGRVTLRGTMLARRARARPPRLDALGVGVGDAGRGRVAELRPAS